MTTNSNHQSTVPSAVRPDSFDYGAGPGYGNKRASNAGNDADDTEFRFGTHTDTKPYSGHNDYGSGTTGGAGFGNKTGAFAEKNGEINFYHHNQVPREVI